MSANNGEDDEENGKGQTEGDANESPTGGITHGRKPRRHHPSTTAIAPSWALASSTRCEPRRR